MPQMWSNYIPSNYYLRASGIFAILALLSLLLCVGFNYNIYQISQDSSNAKCGAAPEESTVQDDEGILRLVKQPTIAGHRVCVVVAGVAPATAAGRLTDEVDRAKTEYERTKNERSEAVRGFAAAATLAAEDKVKADQSEINKEPTAAEYKKAAEQASAEVAKSRVAQEQSQAAFKQADTEYQAAVTAVEKLPPVELVPFLDNYRAAHAAKKVPASARPQAIQFDFGWATDASTPVATFWRDVLSGGTREGEKTFVFGLARNGSEISELQSASEDLTRITFRIYNVWTLRAGLAAMVFLIASIVLLASQTTLLRNNPSLVTKGDIDKSQAALSNAENAARARQVDVDQDEDVKSC